MPDTRPTPGTSRSTAGPRPRPRVSASPTRSGPSAVTIGVIVVGLALAAVGAYTYVERAKAGAAPPTAPVDSCAAERQAFLVASNPIRVEWSDTWSLATSSPRMSLAPIVAKLQEIRRKADVLPSGPCVDVRRRALVKWWDKSLEGMLSFLSSSADAGDHLAEAAALETAFRGEMGEIQQSPPEAAQARLSEERSFTMADYNSLTRGMSLAAAQVTLGSAGTEVSRTNTAVVWSWANAAGAKVSATFEADQLVGMTAIGLRE